MTTSKSKEEPSLMAAEEGKGGEAEEVPPSMAGEEGGGGDVPAATSQDAAEHEDAATVEGGGAAASAYAPQEDALIVSPGAVGRNLRRKSYIIAALLVVVVGLVAAIVALAVNRDGEAAAKAKNEEVIDESNEAPRSQVPALAPVALSPSAPPSSPSTASPTTASPTTAPPTTTASPSPPPSTENALRLQQTLQYLIDFDISEPSTLEPETSSPQYQAAVWIAQEDERRISIPSTAGEGYRFNQRYSLSVLYFSAGGDYWLSRMDFLSRNHECQWDTFSFSLMQILGVWCDGEPDLEDDELDLWDERERVVTGINMVSNNMAGTLPPELRHLRYMKYLYIEDNRDISVVLEVTSLSGKIPPSFAKLKKLRVLSLKRNQLSGNTIEEDLDFLKDMSSLIYLSLEYNAEITGTLPDLSSLTNLQSLVLSNTGMYGTLPKSLAMLKELRKLYLDDCGFEGSVTIIQSMTDLTHIYLEDNIFNDTIDDSFFATFDNLVHLDISNCSFSGTVPGHLFDIATLEVLDISLNNLDGELPAEALSSVQESILKFLSLHTNNISGPIPKGMGNLKDLEMLDLSMNRFSGDIPTDVGELVNLNVLFLGRNDFNEAPVPVWLRNMTELNELSLKSSSMNGSIPSWFEELENLVFLDLGENYLTNTIPQSLGNLAFLRVLMLNSNHLTGELGLGQLQNLEVLLIEDNSLNGNTDEMCAHTLIHFISDCAHSTEAFDVDLRCTCCTLCCFDTNATCNDSEWLGNHEGIWENKYRRGSWKFEDGEVSPSFPYNFFQSLTPLELQEDEDIDKNTGGGTDTGG